jgi:hypothetical protein
LSGSVTGGIRARLYTRGLSTPLTTCFGIKLARVRCVLPKYVRDAKDGLVREALEVFGFFWWLVNYGLSILTSNTLPSVKIYFLVQPN